MLIRSIRRIPAEPIGSLPRPPALRHALAAHAQGLLDDADLVGQEVQAVVDTLARLRYLPTPGSAKRIRYSLKISSPIRARAHS
ncbi:hypothetical protein [Streptomyces sp. NPDC014744]|uniref:hypothetical protein n=1 Tax=Streptomyces sp. NPDC014744 TaxID=3364903 RepID=UPI0036F9703A